MLCLFVFQAEDGIRDLVRSRGLGDVYKRQGEWLHFGLEFGRKLNVHLTTFAADGSLAGHDVWPLSLIHI